MPAAFKKRALDKLYRCLGDLDYTQVDERLAVMLNAILQLESQCECRESGTEAALMVGYTLDGFSIQEKTRWLSRNIETRWLSRWLPGTRKPGGCPGTSKPGSCPGGCPGTRNPGLNNTTEYGTGEFHLPTKPPAVTETQTSCRVLSMIRSQQTEESYPDLSNLKGEFERVQRERVQASLDRDYGHY